MMKYIVICLCLVALSVALVVPCFATEYPSYAPSDIDPSLYRYALWDNVFIFEGQLYQLQANLSLPYIYPYAIFNRSNQVLIFFYDLRSDNIDDLYFDYNSGNGVFAPLLRYARYDIQADGTLKYIGSTTSTPYNTWVSDIEEVQSYIKYSRIDIPWASSFNAPAPFVQANNEPIPFVETPANYVHWIIGGVLACILIVAIVILFFRW